ncbi:MAG: hypothetical protein GC179_22065 [Anaerolineaceae bacterium]|nr:hypothetical protein [Anaerolineaceae bacterium]
MYGLTDFLVAQEIIHIIGREQARHEAQAAAQPEHLSPLGRLINRLPIWTPNQEFALDIAKEESTLKITSCE